MISPNATLTEQVKIVTGLSNTVPSSSVPDYVSLKNYDRCTVIISSKNGTTITGSAITLKQAQAVANTGEKALAFSTANRAINTGSAGNTDVMSAFDVVSNTFTLGVVNSTVDLYTIDVKQTDLDINNGFDCIRAGTADGANQTLTVLYVLYPARFAGAQLPSAITD